MQVIKCEWCNRNADYDTNDGQACVQHLADLSALIAQRVHASGNRWVGEAVEAILARGKVK